MSIFEPQSLPPLVDATAIADDRGQANHSPRIHGVDAIRLVIVHTPEGGYEGTVRYVSTPPDGREWRDGDRRVSYHNLLREDGKQATQLVPWDRKAWHAGAFNSLSEGVAIAGWASKTRALSPGGRRFARIVAFRLRRRGLPARWARDGGGRGFCRHADLQSDRRDPMPLGRWLTFVALVKFEHAREGFRERWGRNR